MDRKLFARLRPCLLGAHWDERKASFLTHDREVEVEMPTAAARTIFRMRGRVPLETELRRAAPRTRRALRTALGVLWIKGLLEIGFAETSLRSESVPAAGFCPG